MLTSIAIGFSDTLDQGPAGEPALAEKLDQKIRSWNMMEQKQVYELS